MGKKRVRGNVKLFMKKNVRSLMSMVNSAKKYQKKICNKVPEEKCEKKKVKNCLTIPEETCRDVPVPDCKSVPTKTPFVQKVKECQSCEKYEDLEIDIEYEKKL